VNRALPSLHGGLLCITLNFFKDSFRFLDKKEVSGEVLQRLFYTQTCLAGLGLGLARLGIK